MLSTVLGFPEVMNRIPFLWRRPQVFPTGWGHNELKVIWCIAWQQTFYHKTVSFFCLFAIFFVEEQRWSKRVVVLLDPSILLGKKGAASRSKYLLDKVQRNKENTYRETFRIFSFLIFGFGGQSDRKWNGRRWNARFSMKRMEEYNRIAFCVKMTQLFILSYLTTPWKMLLYPFLEHPCFILF